MPTIGQSLLERIARELIKENGYTITHLEGGGARALYLTAKETTAQRVKLLSHQALGRIVGCHKAQHSELHRDDTSIYEVNPEFDCSFYNFSKESGRNQLRALAVMVIVAKMSDIIVSDFSDSFEKRIRPGL